MHRIMTCLPLLLAYTFTVAQRNEVQVHAWMTRLSSESTDTGKINTWNNLGRYYISVRKETPKTIDSAIQFFEQSEQLASSVKFTNGYQEAIKQLTRLYYIRGDREKAMMKMELLNPFPKIDVYWYISDFYRDDYKTKVGFKDSAFYYLLKAHPLSIATKNNTYIAYSLHRLASFSYLNNALADGRNYALQAEQYYKLGRKVKDIPALWWAMARSMENRDKNFEEMLFCYDRAFAGFLETRDTIQAINIEMSIGSIYSLRGNQELSERVYLEGLALSRAIGSKEICHVYGKLSDLYRMKGDFNHALFYAFEAVKSAELFTPAGAEHSYTFLAHAYFSLDQMDKCVDILEKCVAFALAHHVRVPGVGIKLMVKALIAQGKKEKALAFVERTVKDASRYSRVEQMVIAESLGNCYHALNKPTLAELHYLKMVEVARLLPAADANVPNYVIGKFYFDTKQFDKSAQSLSLLLSHEHDGMMPSKIVSEAHFMLYCIDTAAHNYLSAIHHLRQHQQLNDILFNETKSKQIAELEIKYDVENKNKDLLLKDQSLLLKEKDIDLLTKQSLLQRAEAAQKNKDIVLQRSHIDLLRKEAELQKALTAQQEKGLLLQKQDNALLKSQRALLDTQLMQAGFTKKITIGCIVLLAIILGLLLNQYRVKQRNVKEVSLSNDKLKRLLQEKEWLVREVHHRVKNNLQVMLSLLESQSAYLKNEALAAIRDSQHRIQAMSLIHQRLYQTENVSHVDMRTYITELAAYLKDSFDTNSAVSFDLSIVALQLEVSKAVPLGLILNEAITNSIKHGFKNRGKGHIRISLVEMENGSYALCIADDGIGLPADFNISKMSSLGVKLIRGLSEDLSASLSINGQGGTEVKVVFEKTLLHA